MNVVFNSRRRAQAHVLALHFRYMLSEKQFCDRARTELRVIGAQVLSLATDRDIYWKLEREIIEPNPRLHGTRSAFVDMLRGAYADALSARVLRLLDSAGGGDSLLRVLSQLGDYPQLLHNKITDREFADDRKALQQAASDLERVLQPHFAHHERTLPALAAVHRALDQAIDLLISTLKTYYWIIAEGYLPLDIQYAEDPLAIFRFAWSASETET
ncbi:MAG: hypothetical protein WA655_06730 [Candidatus Korobacteraceae bacterium]